MVIFNSNALPALKTLLPILGLVAIAAGSLVATTTPAAADEYVITLDPQARDEPADGRVILFFIAEENRRLRGARPIDAPFFQAPQPIASIAVEQLQPGESVIIDGDTFAFPASLDHLDGTIKVQAALDASQTERSFLDEPGNAISEVVEIGVSRQNDDERIEILLSERVEVQPLPPGHDQLKWVEVRSEMLSEFYGRDVFHRAGVALPKGYIDPNAERTHWPAIYVIPGFGGRHTGAEIYGRLHGIRNSEDIAPQAVYIVLDPESPLGHHGFVDSPNHGPRKTALVNEFIPHLEEEFRLVTEPDGRIVTGHSSGGWSALWLQLQCPDVFGGCWSSAPDPVDFSAFQTINLYEDSNLYEQPDGGDHPSYREIISAENDMGVRMTVRQEALMEYAIDPNGRSGQQWDAWEAMYSPADPETGLPVPMFDTRTGEVDREVVNNHWRKFDIAAIVASDWKHYGPIMNDRVRLKCGTLDSYYLNHAVEQLQRRVEQLNTEHEMSSGEGYIHLVEGAVHGNLSAFIFQDWNREMREHLRKHGLHD